MGGGRIESQTRGLERLHSFRVESNGTEKLLIKIMTLHSLCALQCSKKVAYLFCATLLSLFSLRLAVSAYQSQRRATLLVAD